MTSSLICVIYMGLMWFHISGDRQGPWSTGVTGVSFVSFGVVLVFAGLAGFVFGFSCFGAGILNENKWSSFRLTKG